MKDAYLQLQQGTYFNKFLEANPKPNKTENTLYSDLAELLDQTIKDIYEQEISFSAYGKRFMVAISEPE